MFNTSQKALKNIQEQQVLYKKTYVHLWLNLAEFFAKWDTFQTNVVEKIKTRVLYANFFLNRAV